MPNSETVVGLVLVVALIALLFPTLIMSPDGLAKTSLAVEEEQETAVSEQISVYVERVSPSDPANATVVVTDQDSLQSITQTIPTDQTVTYSFDAGDVNVTNLGIGETSVELAVEYPRTFGWDEGMAELAGYLPLLLSGVAVILVVAFAARMIP